MRWERPIVAHLGPKGTVLKEFDLRELVPEQGGNANQIADPRRTACHRRDAPPSPQEEAPESFVHSADGNDLR